MIQMHAANQARPAGRASARSRRITGPAARPPLGSRIARGYGIVESVLAGGAMVTPE